MIMPAIRASVTRDDALHLAELIGHRDPELRAGARARLDAHGIDTLLDDPRLRNALLTAPCVRARPCLILYVLVRQALLESGIGETEIADYVASMLLRFGEGDRSPCASDHKARGPAYLVDMMGEIGEAVGRRKFLLRLHLGNYALWISGMFPDYLEARVRRRGAPPISYYEELGAHGFFSAAASSEARHWGIDGVLQGVAEDFGRVRRALNQMSDRFFWPGAGNPVDRVLREVSAQVH